MALFVGDQSKVVMISESGTYANTSGTGLWIGLVQDHNPDESMGVIPIRYQGAASRNVSVFSDGPIDVTGTVTYYPQDCRLLGYALGSIYSVSGLICSHYYSEANSATGNAFTAGVKAPFMSFTLEDSNTLVIGSNFNRTYKGCVVDSFKISSKQGEPISIDVNYIAQSVTYGSGATTAVTASTLRPFMWSDTKVMIPSGTAYDEVTEWDLSVKNNVQSTHYCNGSRVTSIPIPTNRDYEFNMTYQANSEKTKSLVEQYYFGGSEFNMMLPTIVTLGSRDVTITLSGCKVTSLSTPSPVEGIIEQDVTITAKSASAIETNVILKMTPW